MGNVTGTSGDAFPRASGSEIETLGIDGVGLIGGSIAVAAKARHLCSRVIGFGRSQARLEAARAAGVIDEIATDYSAADRVDLVVCCLPVDRIAHAVREAAKHMRPGTIATDAGSVKHGICEAVGPHPAPGVAFVGSHPLAGSERQGFEHADPQLFEGRTCVVTPQDLTDRSAITRIKNFWRALGCEVVALSSEAHDDILARTSHLPHAVAAAIAAGLANGDERFAASGFRDTTRIAASDSQLWASILLANRTAVLHELEAFIDRCRSMSSALAAADAREVERLLAEGKRRRDAFAGFRQ
jgi:prephenate dehydrogenase